jgi:hypothetical protein
MIVVALCSCHVSTANMSSFKTSRDADGDHESTAFKTGETIYANAVISNAGEKVTVRMYMTADDAKKKDEPLPGSEVKVDLPGSGTAKYSLPIPAGVKSGKYTLVAEMLNENGDKKDGKTAAITIEASANPTAKGHNDDDRSDTDKEDDSGDDDN